MSLRIANLALTDRCNVSRVSQSYDAYNQPTSTSAVVTSNLRCRLTQKVSKELKDNHTVTVKEYRLLLPFGTVVEEKDLVTISGITYQIEFVDSNPGKADSFVEAYLKKVG